MRNRQLIFAREYRGYTQSELSSMIPGLYQSNLSRFEKGLETLSEDLIEKIMNALGFPMAFLNLHIEAVDRGRYQRKATIKASQRGQIKRFISLVSYMVDIMAEDIEFPDFKFSYLDVESGISPQEAARITRQKLKLGANPARDIFQLLEANGVIVYQWDCDINEFDGVSILSDKGYHVVVLNMNMSNDRKRFTLAHELGHIIMHQSPEFIIVESRDKEQEAHDFASEFLMPEAAVRSYLNNLTIKELMSNKQYWLTSMAALLKKAKSIGIVEANRYKNLVIELSRRGWRMNEPVDVYIDKPIVIDSAYSLLKNELSYSLSDIANTAYLPLDVVNRIFQVKQKHKIVFLPQ